MYQALYRKYRPRSFSDVAGQEHVTETLRRQIISGRLSHAYLFVGTRGTGKTTCAKILSRAINCLAPVGGNPCNNCASCTGIENGSILDVLELDAASNNGVDNVRALREEAIYTPATVLKRVYIVDEVHMLSTAAFNALLKILEEPPEHLVFILATTELHKVPATILSRCQRFSFKRLSTVAIAERLASIALKEGIDLSVEAAEKLAALADGSMRDGISLLDQCAADKSIDLQRVLDTIGLAGQGELLRLTEAIIARDTATMLGVLDRLYDDGKSMAALLGELVELTRDLLVCKLSPDSPLLSGGFGRTEVSRLAEHLTPERLFFSLEALKEAALSLSRGGSARMAAELCLIRLCDERLTDDLPALLARVKRLESSESGIRNAESSESNSIFGMRDSEMASSGDCFGSSDIGQMPLVFSNTIIDTIEIKQTDRDNTINLAPDSVIPNFEPVISNSESRTPNSEPVLDFWQDVLELLKNDAAVYAPLSDPSKVQAELRDSILLIRTADIFVAGAVESGMLSDPLKEAACKALGRDIAIRVENSGVNGEVKRSDKLDNLRKFGNVKFE